GRGGHGGAPGPFGRAEGRLPLVLGLVPPAGLEQRCGEPPPRPGRLVDERRAERGHHLGPGRRVVVTLGAAPFRLGAGQPGPAVHAEHRLRPARPRRPPPGRPPLSSRRAPPAAAPPPPSPPAARPGGPGAAGAPPPPAPPRISGGPSPPR